MAFSLGAAGYPRANLSVRE